MHDDSSKSGPKPAAAPPRPAQESEDLYRQLVECAASIILRFDCDGRVTFVNGYGAQTFGYAKEELLGRRVSETIAPSGEDSAPNLEDMISAILAAPDQPRTEEHRNLRRDGTAIWVRWTTTAVHGDQDRPAAVLTIGNDITERVETMRALARAMNHAREASMAKSDFLATMSHEIRTPMNTILGMAELLAETPLTQEQRTLLQTLTRSGAHLVTLIDDILDITRIESGKIELHRDATVPADFLRDCLAVLRSQAEQQGLRLALRLDSPLPEALVCDQTRLRQILLNLLGNAIKFTPSGEVLLSAAAPQPDRLLIRVADTGIGIPEDMREEVFSPFTQADSTITRQYGGVGLGLTICRRLAAIMGGEVRLGPNSGGGTVAELELPLAPPAGRSD